MTGGRGSRAACAACAALAVLPAAGCGDRSAPPAAPEPSVLLITLDTFRADHLGCAGNATVRTPHLDRLARSSVQWTGAVSPIPLTTPSHASILSGLTPRSHGLLRNRMVLREDVRTVAEILRDARLRTGAVVSSPVVLGPELGLSVGFDQYDVVEPVVRPATGEGARTTAAATEWLARHGGPGSFLWVHYFDAHLPYLPPEPFDRLYDPDYDGPYARPAEPVQEIFREGDVDPRDVRHLAALYAGEVTFVDGCVGDLLRAPEAAGAVVLLTADHGEGLWEHERYFGHDLLLYETAVRVPLILRAAGAAGISREPARTVDVAPTLLRLCGLEPTGMEGRDLRNDPPPAGDALQFTLETHPFRSKGESVFALRTETRKVIWIQRARRHEYFDLRADPAERNDLGEGAPRLYHVLAEDLELGMRRRPRDLPGPPDDGAGMDDATREALRSLGYVK